MQPSGLAITPTSAPDPTKPAENASVQVTPSTSGRPLVRVTIPSSPSVDPADPKPPVKDEPKVEDKPADAPKSTERPSWLPEKFATPDALKTATIELAKKQGAPAYVIRGIELSESGQEVSDAYKSFEKQIDPNAGKPKDESKTEDKKDEPKVEEKKDDQPYVKDEATKAHERETYGTYVADMLDKVGVSAEMIGQEFAANDSKLTDATYEKFAKAGVARPFLDAYIAGMVGNARSLAEAHVKEVKSEVFGGEEGFSTVAVWAAANMTKDQHEIYSTLTNSGSLASAKEAARMLKGWYDKANGQPPKARVVPDAPSAPEKKGYASKEEMMAVVRSERYKANDKQVHKEHEEKLRYTNFN